MEILPMGGKSAEWMGPPQRGMQAAAQRERVNIIRGELVALCLLEISIFPPSIALSPGSDPQPAFIFRLSCWLTPNLLGSMAINCFGPGSRSSNRRACLAYKQSCA